MDFLREKWVKPVHERFGGGIVAAKAKKRNGRALRRSKVFGNPKNDQKIDFF